MSPQTGSCRYTHTHLKWFLETLVFSTLHCRDFSFFYFLFSFLHVHKKDKNANEQISYFFPLRRFLSAFFIFAYVFVFLLGCVFVLFGAFVLLVPFVRTKSFRKKKEIIKKFKTTLITSFILLLLWTNKTVGC